ncbi:glycosyltransferase family 2 protein [Serpentinicella alkaliphila]|uniref:Glycosyl transferase family 2 n=1 Tax=Serpentinicella alkaliphila TaxID=1734049 RepID=A0A4R2TKG7_9FIRM|nr:glycosyltransferase family 2 protein [Serpentinicella alkaliphila]QUH26597.1 glycosyltransferase family 2 protein [Serpentinicella alkaliphila]TCQ02937.1 glycosyl transferase family 2 [Serpentinicella alkaliphila]
MKEYISVLIPVYNEEEKIEKTISAIKDIELIDKICVIDDGSKDNTYEIISIIDNIEVIKISKNRGKGNAMQVGLNAVISYSDIIVFLDGDLGESSEEVIKLIKPIINSEAHVSIAKFPKAKKKGGIGLVKKLAKYGVYLHTGVLLDTVISGQRAFRKEVLENIYFPTDYGIEVGTTIDILKKGYKVIEVDVLMHHNETGRNLRGFIHRGRQFIQIFKTLIRKTIS